MDLADAAVGAVTPAVSRAARKVGIGGTSKGPAGGPTGGQGAGGAGGPGGVNRR
jgi:hypothetical protein